jgi:hypothetical protein
MKPTNKSTNKTTSQGQNRIAAPREDDAIGAEWLSICEVEYHKEKSFPKFFKIMPEFAFIICVSSCLRQLHIREPSADNSPFPVGRENAWGGQNPCFIPVHLWLN